MPVENPQKADNPSKTGMFLLGAGLAVSLLANLALAWKKKPKMDDIVKDISQETRDTLGRIIHNFALLLYLLVQKLQTLTELPAEMGD
jgi:hypothetical protein